TESARRTVLVDSVGCPLTITTPTMDAVITPDEQNGADVALTATFQGGDCEVAHASEAADERCDELFEAPAEELAVGQTTLTRSFRLRGEGAHTLCLGIV